MMRLKSVILSVCVGWIGLGAIAAAATTQPSGNPSLVVTAKSLVKLKSLVASDAEAKGLYEKVRVDADGALDDQPNPIELIQTEGKLAGDPVKVKTWESLGDIKKIQALAFAYAIGGDEKYLNKAKAFILAWAKVNRSAGGPIDDTNLDPLFVAYDLTRSQFDDADRKIVDDYCRRIFASEADENTRSGKWTNNWNSHRVKILGYSAWAVQDPKLTGIAIERYKAQIAANIKPDGGTVDFDERDALHYHEYSTTPLLNFAIAAQNNSIDLYGYEASTGSSLKKAVDWFLPFETGEKTHAEFVNSKVDFDRKRAANGQAEYKAGHPWNPSGGVATVERAERFEPNLLPLIIKLTKSDAKRFPTWQSLLNEANRE